MSKRLSAQSYAASINADLDAAEALSPRTVQRTLGPSDIGFCHSKALWKLQGVSPTDAPRGRQSLNGTAVHRMLVEARARFNPRLIHERELEVKLPSGFVLTMHADEIDPDEPSVTDFKTVGDDSDLTVIRREGSEEHQRWQRHLYYLGAHQAGLVPAEGIVRNFWVDRAGRDAWGHVEQEDFSMDEVLAADDWLGSVLYAKEHGEEVPRDRHHDWCASFCEFFRHCRKQSVADDLIVVDPAMGDAARRVFEGRRLAKEGKHLEEVGKRTLQVLQTRAQDDVESFAVGPWRVRWTTMNRSTGPVWRLAVDPRTGDTDAMDR